MTRGRHLLREGQRTRPRPRAQDACHIQAHCRGAAPILPPATCTKTSSTRTSSRARPAPGSWSFCRYPALPLSAIHPLCDHLRQLQSAPGPRAKDARVGAWAAAHNVEIAYTPTNSSWLKTGSKPQFHGPALLRARRHRPLQPPRTGQHDPPVHHLAQQPRLQRTAPPGRRPGKRSLTRHYLTSATNGT